jgi:hypothetical protein
MSILGSLEGALGGLPNTAGGNTGSAAGALIVSQGDLGGALEGLAQRFLK